MNWMNSNYSWNRRWIILLLILICSGLGCQAQTLAEWTKQKKLQTSYKLNQIVALSAYLEVAKKGYEVARVGWNLVGDIQEGEFSLHKGYFGSLTAVHPVIRDYPVPLEILKVYRQIKREVDWMNYKDTDHKMLYDGETEAVNKFNRKIEEQSGLIISELHRLMLSANYEMDDGERLAAIDGLYIGIQQHFQALKSYNDRIRSLELNRIRKEVQKQQLNSFYDVR